MISQTPKSLKKSTLNPRYFPLTILLVFSLSSSTVGQSTTGSSPAAQQPKRVAETSNGWDLELQNIVELAPSLPPEFAADLLLRVSESGKVSDSVKMKLTKQAFDLANKASIPIKQHVIIGSASDTRSGFRGIAMQLDMDRISLQSRAVRQMLPYNASSARSMFEEMQLPNLAPLDCEKSLVYDVEDYYRTLEAVATAAFTPQDKAEGRRVVWIGPYVRNLRSHSQVAPLARLLSSSDLSADELENLARQFTVVLPELSADDRSMADASTRPGESSVIAAMKHLSLALDSKGISSASLVSTLRIYLVSNLSIGRCTEMPTTGTGRKLIPLLASEFNDNFSVSLQNSQLPQIGWEELKNSRVLGEAISHPYWRGRESKELLLSFQKLNYGTKNRPLTTEEKSTFDWSILAKDFAVRLASWDGNGEENTDFFNEKCVLYESLIGILPPSRIRSEALQSYFNFLEQNSAEQISPVEWFWHVKRLLAGAKAPDARQEVLKAFVASRNLILSLNARFELWKVRQMEQTAKTPATQ